MYKKKIFRVLMVASLVFIVGSLIVSSACCLCPEKQVKIKELPIPWQKWSVAGHAVVDVIQLPQDFSEAVVINRQWTALPEPIALEDLMWDKTEAIMRRMQREWMGADKEPMQIRPGGELTVDIPVTAADRAVVVRYDVALAAAPEEALVQVVNLAEVEVANTAVITGRLSNFNVHNNTCVEVDNFELDLYGIKPSDVTWWYPGWGAPPDINKIPGGTEVKWKDADNPVKSCTWVHFGLRLGDAEPERVRAFWTRLCP